MSLMREKKEISRPMFWCMARTCATFKYALIPLFVVLHLDYNLCFFSGGAQNEKLHCKRRAVSDSPAFELS